ncbi:hypothetical protein DIPPA_14476 [Diplonema papillatum]|nr:hypothetical protein DIPPA_14476 [Diplonema papillatum]
MSKSSGTASVEQLSEKDSARDGGSDGAAAPSHHAAPRKSSHQQHARGKARKNVRSNIVWNSNFVSKASLPSYNSLFDGSLRTYYGKNVVRSQLVSNALIDPAGQILRPNATKLAIIQQEFDFAERDDARRRETEAYERQKLHAKKCWMREQHEKARRSLRLRLVELEKRGRYDRKVVNYLPMPPIAPKARQAGDDQAQTPRGRHRPSNVRMSQPSTKRHRKLSESSEDGNEGAGVAAAGVGHPSPPVSAANSFQRPANVMPSRGSRLQDIISVTSPAPPKTADHAELTARSDEST